VYTGFVGLLHKINTRGLDAAQRDSSEARSLEAGDTRHGHGACNRGGDKSVVDACFLGGNSSTNFPLSPLVGMYLIYKWASWSLPPPPPMVCINRC
jgi:hypothetical protein